MKRQNTLNTYFAKKLREETSATDESRSSTPTIEATSSTSQEQIIEISSSQNNDIINLPSCWNSKQLKDFQMKYDGLLLVIRNWDVVIV